MLCDTKMFGSRSINVRQSTGQGWFGRWRAQRLHSHSSALLHWWWAASWLATVRTGSQMLQLGLELRLAGCHLSHLHKTKKNPCQLRCYHRHLLKWDQSKNDMEMILPCPGMLMKATGACGGGRIMEDICCWGWTGIVYICWGWPGIM